MLPWAELRARPLSPSTGGTDAPDVLARTLKYMRPDYVHFDDIYWIRVGDVIYTSLEREGALLFIAAVGAYCWVRS